MLENKKLTRVGYAIIRLWVLLGLVGGIIRMFDSVSYGSFVFELVTECVILLFFLAILFFSFKKKDLSLYLVFAFVLFDIGLMYVANNPNDIQKITNGLIMLVAAYLLTAFHSGTNKIKA